MGFLVIHRFDLIKQFNHDFSPANIAATVARLQPIDPAWDFLDIMDRLGHLAYLQPGQLAAYRRNLTIPQLHQALLTQILLTSLTRTPPAPIVFHVFSGLKEGLEITDGGKIWHVLLTRNDYDTMYPPDFRP